MKYAQCLLPIRLVEPLMRNFERAKIYMYYPIPIKSHTFHQQMILNHDRSAALTRVCAVYSSFQMNANIFDLKAIYYYLWNTWIPH